MSAVRTYARAIQVVRWNSEKTSLFSSGVAFLGLVEPLAVCIRYDSVCAVCLKRSMEINIVPEGGYDARRPKENANEVRTMDGPCDRPRNHAMMCGARVAAVDIYGDFSGRFGVVARASISVSVTSNVSSFDTYYEILMDDGERVYWEPLKTFRKCN